MILVTEYTTKHPLEKIGYEAGICFNSKTDDYKKNVDRAIGCIKSGHGRVLEFVDVELIIDGYSARVIREWYTHIGGSPTRLQESTRYVDCDNFKFTVPKMNEVQSGIYHTAMESVKAAYKQLKDSGMSTEDCGLILPLGMTTKIVDKRNLRSLLEMSHQRICTRAYWEYRNLMQEIKKELSNYSVEWKYIMDNFFVPKCELLGYCPEKNSCGRKAKR